MRVYVFSMYCLKEYQCAQYGYFLVYKQGTKMCRRRGGGGSGWGWAASAVALRQVQESSILRVHENGKNAQYWK